MSWLTKPNSFTSNQPNCKDGACAANKKQGCSFGDQYHVPPYKQNMKDSHPCASSNSSLGLCQDLLDPSLLLAARVVACNSQRQVLMKCRAKVERARMSTLAADMAKQKMQEVNAMEGATMSSGSS